jgi:hypothetical protein
LKANRPTEEQKARWERIVGYGCIVCRRSAEIHHIETKMGCRKDHSRTIPLCPYHHRIGQRGMALHAGKKEFEKNFGSESELLDKINELIGE